MDIHDFQSSDPTSPTPALGGEPPQNRKGLLGPIARISAMVLIVVGVALTSFAYSWLKTLGVFDLDPSHIESLSNFTYGDNSVVFDRNGAKIGEYFERYQLFTPKDALPENLVNAILAIEDRDFLNHHGIDIKAMIRATWARLRKGKITQGASTLTQQVAKTLLLNSEKTMERKAMEIAWSLEIEKHLSKSAILQIYTNTMFLGNGAYGVGAAAQRYFAKDVRKLTLAECALIAGLFQSPSRYNPARWPERAKRRQLQVLSAMVSVGFITKEAANEAKNEELKYKEYRAANAETAPWFVDWVFEQLPSLIGKQYKSSLAHGLRIYTTLDSQLQHFAEHSIEGYGEHLDAIGKKTGTVIDPGTGNRKLARLEASMLVTDPADGSILAMVGGRNYHESQFNRTASAMRSPGSSFKPVVYTEALMRGMKWSDVIFVSPVNIENYRPRSSEDDYLTETTMMRALYKSMNAPTIEVASKLGLKSVIQRAKNLGISSPIKEELGSVLGSSDATMMDLSRMYNVFASSGTLREIKGIQKIVNSEGKIIYEAPALNGKKSLTPQIAYLMTQGLRSVLTSGTGVKSAELAKYAAGKTGTSNNSSDNWFCGYTPNLTAVVWVGTDEHTPIFANVTGGALALPIWDTFMRAALAVRPAKPFVQPPGIVSATVHPLYGHRIPGGSLMYFLESNGPKETASAFESIEARGGGGYRNVFQH